MLRRKTTLAAAAFLALLPGRVLTAQQAPDSARGAEFPVTMRQNLAAGTTPAGTKVEAKLVIATFVHGAVIPRNAVLSGVVTESVAKSAASPSRLAIRIDEARWKNQVVPLTVYLTAWYYPSEAMSDQNLSYEPPDAARSPKNWNGAGTYPDPNSPASQPFPGRDQDRETGPTPPSSPASNISQHRALLKNVECSRNPAGELVLTSARSNIKLDKLTTYVLASDNLLPAR